jgi:TetR/AcrR family transcriptional regulator, transcriptional repressor for nem operon
MRKGERTREAILGRAAELFNRQGYAGSSLSDIMEATGLQKGGIYNHFESKDRIALEAFDYGFNLVSERFMAYIKDKREPLERLLAVIGFFRTYFDSPPVPGGCMLLNTAIESDDTHPALRERARRAMESWRGVIQRAALKGIRQGMIRSTIDPDALATFLISALEGGIMMSKLYGDPGHIQHVVDQLTMYVENSVKA